MSPPAGPEQPDADSDRLRARAGASASPAAAAQLCILMSEISEEHYCAGWMSGLEYTLWAMLLGGDRGFGVGDVTDDPITQLRALSEASGGWWRYDDDADEVFVPIEEWTRRYEAHRSRRR